MRIFPLEISVLFFFGVVGCWDAELNCPGAVNTFFLDADGDGYGDPETTVDACDVAPSGYIEDGTDCNDENNAVHPGAFVIANNNLDDDCDGSEPKEIVCITPIDAVAQIPWIPMLSNTTEFPTNNDPNWSAGYGITTGQACISDQAVATSDAMKIQGQFDADGDGDYGDYSSGSTDFSLGMLDSDNLDVTNPDAVTVMGDPVLFLAPSISDTSKDYTFMVAFLPN